MMPPDSAPFAARWVLVRDDDLSQTPSKPFYASGVTEKEGFEPSKDAYPHGQRDGTEPAGAAPGEEGV
jgi:hypothetical protein